MTAHGPRSSWPNPAPDPAAAALAELATAAADATTPRGWMNLAACAGSANDMHHPTGAEDSRVYAARAEMAKRICRTCPVVVECLSWALDNGEDYGIWGGMTPAERRALRTARKAPAQQEEAA